LNEPTILTNIAGSLAYLLTSGFIHNTNSRDYEPWRFNTWRAFDCMMLMKSIARI
jgi:hypothetical protein